MSLSFCDECISSLLSQPEQNHALCLSDSIYHLPLCLSSLPFLVRPEQDRVPPLPLCLNRLLHLPFPFSVDGPRSPSASLPQSSYSSASVRLFPFSFDLSRTTLSRRTTRSPATVTSAHAGRCCSAGDETASASESVSNLTTAHSNASVWRLLGFR